MGRVPYARREGVWTMDLGLSLIPTSVRTSVQEGRNTVKLEGRWVDRGLWSKPDSHFCENQCAGGQ